MCVSQGDDSALPGFHTLREACRAGVHRQATLGVALLFNGNCTLLLIEGEDTAVLQLRHTLQALAAHLPLQAWQQTCPPDAPRHLPPGLCRSGYLDDDAACAICEVLPDAHGSHGTGPGASDGPADRLVLQAGVAAFLRMLDSSDHD